MNDDVVIRFENVSKKYKIRSGGLRHAVQNAASRLNPFRWFGDDGKPPRTEAQNLNSRTLNESIVEDGKVLWALQDVSFEVKRGEVLGIIGSNGAGKSTILKLLSGITSPTSGNIEVKGKVAALIEVGAGFHPELTGRENIYLNGSILGLKKKEIDEKFDSIVDFSELERFLDTPVKKYSSGMYVRLGFSVAVHIEPDILLIDEVLSVGDEAFRRKCLTRMSNLRERNTTIIFVSHDLNSVQGLTEKAILLCQGEVRCIGETKYVIEAYREDVLQHERMLVERVEKSPDVLGNSKAKGAAQIIDVKLFDGNGKEKYLFQTGEKMLARISYITTRKLVRPFFGFGIERLDDLICYGSTTQIKGYSINEIEGTGTVEIEFKALNLLTNSYRMTAAIGESGGNIVHDISLDAAFFQVKSSNEAEGAFYLEHEWRL